MRPKSFLRRDDGAVAIEFAFVVPVLLTLLFTGYEASRVASAAMRLNDSAQMMADLVSRQKNLTAAQLSDFCLGVKLAMTPLSTAAYRATIASVTRSASGIVVDWQDESCGSGKAIASPTTLAAPYLQAVNDSIIIVQASYDYHPVVNSAVSPVISLSRIGFARTREGVSVVYF